MISEKIRYVGADDPELTLFEGQYPVDHGISYNSYLILDEKTALLDTVDERKADEFLQRLRKELAGRTLDYLIISHVEPDHSAAVGALLQLYPKLILVGNALTFKMLEHYFCLDKAEKLIVKENDRLSLGAHTLQFMMAPLVHWPEVMVSYELSKKILFSADGFGKFGALAYDEPWDEEAARYYFNIVGKFGAQTQALLKKTAALDIKMIAPLHGPLLTSQIPHAVSLYDRWSRYEAESDGVFITYTSLHGNTEKAARYLHQLLKENGVASQAFNLVTTDFSYAIREAFRYQKLVLAAPTYDGGLMPVMEDFLHHLKAKNFQKRKLVLIENGTWAPCAARLMKALIEQMKDNEVIDTITLMGPMKKEQERALQVLVKQLKAE